MMSCINAITVNSTEEPAEPKVPAKVCGIERGCCKQNSKSEITRWYDSQGDNRGVADTLPFHMWW